MTPKPRHPALLGIDVGTSSVKLLLYFLGEGPRGEGRTRLARVRLTVDRPHPGHSEMDPRQWWRGIRRAAAALDLEDAEVLGIGTSSLFPALVPMDAAGTPLRPALLYDDRRSGAEVAELEHSPLAHPEVHHLLTGNRVRPGTISLSSLLWMRRHELPLFRETHVFGHVGTFVGRRLTGRFAIDATSASLTGLYATASGEAWLRGVCRLYGVSLDRAGRRLEDLTYGNYLDLLTTSRPGLKEQILADLPPGAPREALLGQRVDLPEGGWVSVLLDVSGIDRARLPEVLWPGDRLGTLTAAAAEALGLPAGIPVAAGAGDTPCGALAMGLAGEGEMAVTCGSTDSLASLQRTAVFSPRTINIAYMDACAWLAIAPMNATGAAVDWFVETFLGRARDRYERFFALAAEAPPGSGGAVFLPYLRGERSPVYDPSARGVFFGLTPRSGLAEMARAVLEGVAFGHRQILGMADVRLGRRVARVIASGGGTRNPLWRQIRADAADRPYVYSDCTEASALGAALLGGVAAGVFDSWHAAAAEARRTARFEEVRPTPHAWHRIKRNFEIYSSLYDALRHCF
jgi:sugar (pentulose or hexulose) kinase